MSGVQYLTTQDIISNDIHFDYPVPQEHGTFELECPNVATGVKMSCQVAAITYPETVDFGSLSEMTLDVYGALNAVALYLLSLSDKVRVISILVESMDPNNATFTPFTRIWEARREVSVCQCTGGCGTCPN